MVTRLKPSLAVSDPGPPPLRPEAPKPGAGPVFSQFLSDSQLLQPRSSPCHPILSWPFCPSYAQSLITLVIFPSMLVKLMEKANRSLSKCGTVLLNSFYCLIRKWSAAFLVSAPSLDGGSSYQHEARLGSEWGAGGRCTQPGAVSRWDSQLWAPQDAQLAQSAGWEGGGQGCMLSHT